MTAQKQTTRGQSPEIYSTFDQLDGEHPWMAAVPEGFIPYQVREVEGGKVCYFNFALAKEMGLIPADHPHQMNSALREKILSTFCIQIINEYDLQQKKKFNPNSIKSKPYMASRYLQLQHDNKQGKTSGDGRGIWNGVVRNRGRTWDVSSRGTGVTRLAPGSAEANHPLRTGGEEYGYGCGLAELDELVGAAILAEIMHLQGVGTERVLTVLDLGKGHGIGVRAAPNLLRPAHLFLYLKQNRVEELRAATDYLIQRQMSNGAWKFTSQKSRYDEMVRIISESFAEFAARLDMDYVFAWLDWDGDNVLAEGGIIDYGSVRQFGIRHDGYRYDDVERFSTNLNEQRIKARLIVQVFAQLADCIKTGHKKPLREFAKHPEVLEFNSRFAKARTQRLLYRLGFDEEQRRRIIVEDKVFRHFEREFDYFERAKVSGAPEKVADGINHPALFNLRVASRILPQTLLKPNADGFRDHARFFAEILSSFAKRQDTKMRPKHKAHLENLLTQYQKLVGIAAGRENPHRIIKAIADRAQRLNADNRLTGNALIHVVDELIQERKKGLTERQFQQIIEQLVYSYAGLPEVEMSRHVPKGPRTILMPELFDKIQTYISQHQDDI